VAPIDESRGLGVLRGLVNGPRWRAVATRCRSLWAHASKRLQSEPAERAWSVFATLVTLAFPIYVFLLFNDGMEHRADFGDEGFFAWCGWALTKGLTPYRDFLEFKPPLVFLTYALALKLFGFAAWRYREFFTYFPLASIVALQVSLLSRRVDRLLAMGLTLALIQVWVTQAFHDTALTDTESIGLTFYFLGVAFLIARSRWPAIARAVGTGFLICCAQSKEPFLPCVGITWAACFFMSERRGSFRTDAIRYTKNTAIGAAVVVVGLCLYMIPTGALVAYVRVIRRYTILYRDPVQSFCVAGGVFHPTTPLSDLWRQWCTVSSNYLNLPLAGFLIPFAAVTIIYLWRRSLAQLAITALACVAGFIAVAASNCPWRHYYNMVLGGLFFALAVGLDAMMPDFRLLARPVRVVIRVAMLTGLFIVLWPRLLSEQAAFGKRTFASPMIEPVPGVFDAVRKYTTPDDRIATSGNPILYVQVNRRSAIRESNLLDPILGFYVGNTDEEKLRPVYDELVKSRPKLVVLDPSYAHARPRHQRALWGPFLANYHYTKLTEQIYLRPD
jgi:hypothetical protein